MASSRKVRVNVEIPLSTRKALKRLSLELGLTMTAIANQALLDYIEALLEQSNLPPSVKAQIKADLHK